MTGPLMLNSVVKYLLTEGEKIILVGAREDLEQQGIYALVQNLGSLVARFVFQPLEETAALEFGALFATKDARPRSASPAIDDNRNHNHTHNNHGQISDDGVPPARESNVDAMLTGAELLGFMLKFEILVGLLFIALGPNYSLVLFEIAYKSRWARTAAPTALSYYCVYILAMAVNGITEAFVAATSKPTQLTTNTLVLIPFSAVYLGATWASVMWRYGAVGLIAANCFNMAVRITYSAIFTAYFFKSAPPALAPAEGTQHRPAPNMVLLSWILPKPAVLAAFACSYAVTALSFYLLGIRNVVVRYDMYALHVAVGAICCLFIALAIHRREKDLVERCKALWYSRKRAQPQRN
jgi:oligosaccharide translocation protein RFT1